MDALVVVLMPTDQNELGEDERRLVEVERLARVIAESDGEGSWASDDDTGREEYRINARAVLAYLAAASPTAGAERPSEAEVEAAAKFLYDGATLESMDELRPIARRLLIAARTVKEGK